MVEHTQQTIASDDNRALKTAMVALYRLYNQVCPTCGMQHIIDPPLQMRNYVLIAAVVGPFALWLDRIGWSTFPDLSLWLPHITSVHLFPNSLLRSCAAFIRSALY